MSGFKLEFIGESNSVEHTLTFPSLFSFHFSLGDIFRRGNGFFLPSGQKIRQMQMFLPQLNNKIPQLGRYRQKRGGEARGRGVDKKLDKCRCFSYLFRALCSLNGVRSQKGQFFQPKQTSI